MLVGDNTNKEYQVVSSMMVARVPSIAQGQIKFFAPHCLLVKKNQASSITQNSGWVSPPSPTRITIPIDLRFAYVCKRKSKSTVNAREL